MHEHKTIPQRLTEHERLIAELTERVATLERALAKANKTAPAKEGDMTTPLTAKAWFKAWEREMNERGYPNAHISWERDGDEWRYGWTPDLEQFMRGEFMADEDWAAAHVAFVMVEPLRPPHIQPSSVLVEMMAMETP